MVTTAPLLLLATFLFAAVAATAQKTNISNNITLSTLLARPAVAILNATVIDKNTNSTAAKILSRAPAAVKNAVAIDQKAKKDLINLLLPNSTGLLALEPLVSKIASAKPPSVKQPTEEQKPTEEKATTEKVTTEKVTTEKVTTEKATTAAIVPSTPEAKPEAAAGKIAGFEAATLATVEAFDSFRRHFGKNSERKKQDRNGDVSDDKKDEGKRQRQPVNIDNSIEEHQHHHHRQPRPIGFGASNKTMVTAATVTPRPTTVVFTTTPQNLIINITTNLKNPSGSGVTNETKGTAMLRNIYRQLQQFEDEARESFRSIEQANPSWIAQIREAQVQFEAYVDNLNGHFNKQVDEISYRAQEGIDGGYRSFQDWGDCAQLCLKEENDAVYFRQNVMGDLFSAGWSWVKDLAFQAADPFVRLGCTGACITKLFG